ncbi:CDP-glycerol glycerophosphotransferase family protein [Campylobacter devanensis]|uniref:CDP-glycerol glycerophosphotransferase family protein n=1 Tax=Campylobacter devanensis TaxID=3161138 RepID=UPI000A3324E7|nr:MULTISPECIES: CDP-glycerol glycerophosphotransferase family protein [unclassified Campylobacter]
MAQNKIISNKIITGDLKEVYNAIDWEFARDKVFFITGATGVIGSFLVRCLNYANKQSGLGIKIVLPVRDLQKVRLLYNVKETTDANMEIIQNDITNKIIYKENVDYIIHCASNTASMSFVNTPEETFNISAKGTENILNFAKEKKIKSMIYLSSMEAYGNIDKPRKLKENDLGEIDDSNPRNSYPLGKREAENLCYKYAKENDLEVKIIRLAQVIGASVDYGDTRVFSHFARSIVEKKDIVLNTPAQTTSSYCYISDTIIGILNVLMKGKSGECYNLANEESTIRICDLAKKLSQKYTTSKLIFDLKDSPQYQKTTHWILDTTKLQALGWSPKVTLDMAFSRLISSFYYQKVGKPKNETILQVIKKFVKTKILDKIHSVKTEENFRIHKLFGIEYKIKRFKFVPKYLKLPIDKNKIVFLQFNGKGYGCNPKYIAEEILKRNLNYDLVWLLKKNENSDDIPEKIRIVDYSTKEGMRELCTARIIIENVRTVNDLLRRGWKKKDEQIYIQTWHGSLGIKRLDTEVKAFAGNEVELSKLIELDSEMMDYLITNSEFDDEVLPPALLFDKKTSRFGHPRNDICFWNKEQLSFVKEKVYNELSIDINYKTFLYMPSFRDNGTIDCYTLDLEKLKKSLENRFQGKWKILIRMHPRIMRYSKRLFKYNENIVDASKYSDIQELLVSADMAMTDYSSCIFDFMLTRKPAFIFATDIKEYDNARGFYYPLTSTPFPVATTNEELCENIKSFDYEKYKNDVEEFLKGKGCMEDGKASARVVDLIQKCIDQGNK